MKVSSLQRLSLVLLALCVLPTASTHSNFLDLNSLQAFHPASSHDDVLVTNNTELYSSSPNPSSNLYSSSRPTSKAAPAIRNTPKIDDPSQDIIKREGACGRDFRSCRLIGAPSLCCRGDQVCSADFNGQVACCPVGAVCTGVVPGGRTSVTVVTTTTSRHKGGDGGGGGGFVVVGSSTVAVLGGSGNALRPVSADRCLSDPLR